MTAHPLPGPGPWSSTFFLLKTSGCLTGSTHGTRRESIKRLGLPFSIHIPSSPWACPRVDPTPARPPAPEFMTFSGSSPGIQCPVPASCPPQHRKCHVNPIQSWERFKGYSFFFLFLSPVSLNEHKYIEIYILFLRFDSSPKNKIEHLQNKTPQTS